MAVRTTSSQMLTLQRGRLQVMLMCLHDIVKVQEALLRQVMAACSL